MSHNQHRRSTHQSNECANQLIVSKTASQHDSRAKSHNQHNRSATHQSNECTNQLIVSKTASHDLLHPKKLTQLIEVDVNASPGETGEEMVKVSTHRVKMDDIPDDGLQVYKSSRMQVNINKGPQYGPRERDGPSVEINLVPVSQTTSREITQRRWIGRRSSQSVDSAMKGIVGYRRRRMITEGSGLARKSITHESGVARGSDTHHNKSIAVREQPVSYETENGAELDQLNPFVSSGGRVRSVTTHSSSVRQRHSESFPKLLSTRVEIDNTGDTSSSDEEHMTQTSSVQQRHSESFPKLLSTHIEIDNTGDTSSSDEESTPFTVPDIQEIDSSTEEEQMAAYEELPDSSVEDEQMVAYEELPESVTNESCAQQEQQISLNPFERTVNKVRTLRSVASRRGNYTPKVAYKTRNRSIGKSITRRARSGSRKAMRRSNRGISSRNIVSNAKTKQSSNRKSSVRKQRSSRSVSKSHHRSRRSAAPQRKLSSRSYTPRARKISRESQSRSRRRSTQSSRRSAPQRMSSSRSYHSSRAQTRASYRSHPSISNRSTGARNSSQQTLLNREDMLNSANYKRSIGQTPRSTIQSRDQSMALSRLGSSDLGTNMPDSTAGVELNRSGSCTRKCLESLLVLCLIVCFIILGCRILYRRYGYRNKCNGQTNENVWSSSTSSDYENENANEDDYNTDMDMKYDADTEALRLRQFMLERLFEEPESLREPNIMESELDVEGGIQLVGWQWKKKLLRLTWIFFMFLIVASLVKVGYHHSIFLTTTIPESCILIIIGLAFGALIRILDIYEDVPNFSVDLFFFALLPPIILESAYSLHDHSFFNNLVTILMYAIVGTLINVILIGFSLFIVEKICNKYNVLDFPSVPLIELMTFATAISAVDPVCVLAIFHDLGVNKSLYFLVFGESLFNDAVVIVLHRLMSAFVRAEIITAKDIINGMLYFFLISIGGLLVGILFGYMTALITKLTKHVRVVEPMFMIAMVYLSFLTAELLEWSGLISMIGCGLVQVEYAFANISLKSYTTVKYFTKTLSSLSDLLIFFFLGSTLINDAPVWNTAFVVFSILFCIVYRIVSVFSLSYVSNNYFLRNRLINFEEQTVMAYGGLRGAVAFAIIAIIEAEHGITNIRLFRTSTLAIILFTVFILGGTTKPLLNLLRIQRETGVKDKLFVVINDKVIEATLNGIEGIAGNRSVVYYFRHWISKINEKYVRKFLTNGKTFDNIENVWKKEVYKEELHKITDDDEEDEKSPIEGEEGETVRSPIQEVETKTSDEQLEVKPTGDGRVDAKKSTDHQNQTKK